MTNVHPLKEWLTKSGKTAFWFSRESGIPMRTVYDQIDGDVEAPTIQTMKAIEKATQGDVSVGNMIDWFGRKK